MEHLQDFAMDSADQKSLIFVFTSGDSRVPDIFYERSSKSRLESPVILGDITDQEAVRYLRCKCQNASNDTIANAVKLTG